MYLAKSFRDRYRSNSRLALLPEIAGRMLLDQREDKKQLMLILSRLSFSKKTKAEETKILCQEGILSTSSF
jgi:hypothetical protein